MEGHAEGVICKLLIDLQLETHRGAIAPNLDCLVRRARHNEILLDADVHSGDGSRMERVDQVFVHCLHVLVV